MIYPEEDFLQLSGLQHFKFCRRQWALIHIERQWAENFRTTDGAILHENAHNSDLTESRGDLLVTRDMRIFSPTLGVSGACDVLEFHRGDTGIPLKEREGLWQPFPVEYKRGRPKEHNADTLQLCGQALCLEEMLCCEIPRGALYYGETRQRTEVVFTPELRQEVRDLLHEMHALYDRGHTPKVKPTKGCNACSLKEPLPAKADEKQSCFRVSAPWNGGGLMRQLLNTLFVTSEDVYLSLDGENVVANRGGEAVARYPLHTLQSIVSFSYSGASPALMGACARHGIGLAFCTPRGRFLARVSGVEQGNVLLRRMQYRAADDPVQSCRIARNMIFGKVYNGRWSVERTRRDHAMRIEDARFAAVSAQLHGLLPQIAAETSLESLRGLEGVGAAAYFSVLNDMILREKDAFYFKERSRRPPLDAFNAMLSFAYSLLVHDCASALESVGLDAYVGYLHRDRPGRESLALDLMEELRPCFADRFVLTLVNNRVIQATDFDTRESGAVFLKDTARKTFLQKWQERKKETITHPFLEEKVPWGLVPYLQSLLLARYLRGDLDAYLPFLWK